MTDVKITDLPDGQNFKNGDVLPIVRAGITVKVVRDQAGAAAVFEANATATTINTQNVFEEIAGTLLLQGGSNFSITGGNKLQYTGTLDQQNSIVWWTFSATVGAGGMEEQFAFKVHLNGSPIAGRCTIKPDIDDSDAAALSVLIGTLTSGDVISFEVANLDGVKDITITDQSIAVLAD